MPPLPPVPLSAVFSIYKRCRLRTASRFELRSFKADLKHLAEFLTDDPLCCDLTPSTIDAVAAWLARERHADRLDVELFRDHMGKLMRFAHAMQRPAPQSTLAIFKPEPEATVTSGAELPVTFTGDVCS